MLAVRVLGGFNAHLNGKPIRINRNHAKQLLVYLIMEDGREVPRERFGEMFWPEAERKTQLEKFRNVLMMLERKLGQPGYIRKNGVRSIAFNITQLHTLDAAALLACETQSLDDKSAEWLMNLSASYQPLLPEFEESWVVARRSHLETVHDERVMRALVNRLLADRKWVALADWGRRAIACPANTGYEPVYVSVMRAEYQLHNPKAVSDLYTQLTEALGEEGLAPSRAARELYERLLRETEPLLDDPPQPQPKPGPPLATTAPALHLPDHLRNPPTPLIGRDLLLKRVVASLDEPHRQLITLLGIGGIGKTRLAAAAAVEAAHHAAQNFVDGVYFVEADAAQSADSFYAMLAERLHFSPYGQASLKQQVLDYLREKRVLLLVDNFETLLEQSAETPAEQSVDGAALIEELCVKAPSVKVLVTTRQSLQLLRETVFDVDGLDVPADAEQPDATSYGAVALFAEIAGRVNDAFSLTRELPAVVSICHMVGGTPLAIEIAAALVRGMSCKQIAARIVENLDALISQWRNISPRQRSLRAVLEYAYSLLTPNEQAVFAQASVFVGGFTQEAASEVAQATHSSLRALKDCALTRQDIAARYFMHSFVRQFSAEKLRVIGQIEPTQNRLVSYTLAYAQSHAESQTGLMPEWANLLEGLRLAHIKQSWPAALALADVLSEPWYTAARYGDIRQGIAWAYAAAEALGDERAQSRLLSHWGRACVRQGNYAEADAYFERGLKLAWKLIDSPSIARVLYERAQLLIERSELKQADEMLDQCLEIYEELGDKLGMAEGLRQKARALYNSERDIEANVFATRAYELLRGSSHKKVLTPLLRLMAEIARNLGEYANAISYCNKAIIACNEFADHRELGLLYYCQAQIARETKQYAEAKKLAKLSYDLLKQIGDRKISAHVTTLIGYISIDQGHYAEALSQVSQGIEILREMQDALQLIRPLFRLGEIYEHLKQLQQASHSFEEGLRLAEQFNHPLAPTLHEKLDLLNKGGT